VIRIVDPNPAWGARFEVEATRIRGALGGRALAVEHVGSTAVPGLAAKPVVDVCVVVADSADEAAYLPSLEEAGYELRVREPGWYEHRMVRTPAADVHVHVFSVGCPEIDRMLAFRDHLRIDERDRDLYAATKRELATRDWSTMDDYATAKRDVVADIMSRALATDDR
jgi:GrpB-like predicted nucleotidyltransferase (UPF0157 family)